MKFSDHVSLGTDTRPGGQVDSHNAGSDKTWNKNTVAIFLQQICLRTLFCCRIKLCSKVDMPPLATADIVSLKTFYNANNYSCGTFYVWILSVIVRACRFVFGLISTMHCGGAEGCRCCASSASQFSKVPSRLTPKRTQKMLYWMLLGPVLGIHAPGRTTRPRKLEPGANQRSVICSRASLTRAERAKCEQVTRAPKNDPSFSQFYATMILHHHPLITGM